MSVGPIIDVEAWNPAHEACNKRNLLRKHGLLSCLLKRARLDSSYVSLLLAVKGSGRVMT